MTELFLKEQQNIDCNLYFTRSHFEKSLKDDREIKATLIRKMINFQAFQWYIRKLGNGFKKCACKSYNSEIQKKIWYPTAHYLIRKYILENHIVPQCCLTSAQPSAAVLTDVGTKLLEKVKCSWQNGSSKLWFKGK